MPTSHQDPTRNDAGLLENQLEEALLDARAARGPAFEVALLAGLRERLPGRPAILAEVETWIGAEGAEMLAHELPKIRVAPRAEALLTRFDEAADDEFVDALLAFDELCAGFTYCGVQDRCANAAHLVARAVTACPEAWSPLSDFASRILAHAPPDAQDPAGRLWRAIEATHTPQQPAALEPAQIIPLQRFRRELERLAASSGAPHLQSTALGSSARVVFVESHEGPELLIELEDPNAHITVECEGRALTLSQVGVRWSCPAQTGLYVITINGTPHPIEIS